MQRQNIPVDHLTDQPKDIIRVIINCLSVEDALQLAKTNRRMHNIIMKFPCKEYQLTTTYASIQSRFNQHAQKRKLLIKLDDDVIDNCTGGKRRGCRGGGIFISTWLLFNTAAIFSSIYDAHKAVNEGDVGTFFTALGVKISSGILLSTGITLYTNYRHEKIRGMKEQLNQELPALALDAAAPRI